MLACNGAEPTLPPQQLVDVAALACAASTLPPQQPVDGIVPGCDGAVPAVPPQQLVDGVALAPAVVPLSPARAGSQAEETAAHKRDVAMDGFSMCMCARTSGLR